MTTAFTWLSPTKRAGQLDPVGQLPQQRRAGMADHAGAVGGDFEPRTRVGSLHPQGALHDLGYDRETAVSSLVRGLLAQLGASPPTRPHEKLRLVATVFEQWVRIYDRPYSAHTPKERGPFSSSIRLTALAPLANRDARMSKKYGDKRIEKVFEQQLALIVQS